MALRTLDIGFEVTRSTKSYASSETAAKKGEEIAGLCSGMVNVRIVPVQPITTAGDSLRYIPIFYCFEKEQDMCAVARLGFHCFR